MSRLLRQVTLVPLCVGALLLIAACGGGEADEPSLTREDWIAMADAACAAGNAQLEELAIPESPDELAGLGSEEFANLMSRAADIGQEQLEALRALNPPAEVREDFDRLLELTEDQVDAVRDLSEAPSERVPDLFSDLARISQEADTIIAKYEFVEC